MRAEKRRMSGLDYLAASHVKMDPTWHARIEASHGPHDINAFEIIPAVLLENGGVCYCVLIRSRCAKPIAWTRIPRGRWIGVIIGDSSPADDHVMTKSSPHSLMKTATDGVIGNFELIPSFQATGVNLLQGLVDEMKRRGRRKGLEIRAGAVAFKGVAPFRDVPFEFALAVICGFG